MVKGLRRRRIQKWRKFEAKLVQVIRNLKEIRIGFSLFFGSTERRKRKMLINKTKSIQAETQMVSSQRDVF